MADKPAFTITSYTDKGIAEKVAAGDLPSDTDVIRHNLSDASGALVAVGMSEAEAREAIAARHGADVTGLVKKGALGHDSDGIRAVSDLGG